MNEKVEKAIAKAEKAEKTAKAMRARARLEEQKEKDLEKKREDKRKYLVGAMVVHFMKRSPEYEKEIIAQLDKFLTRDFDRKYFGLAPKNQK